MPEPTEPPDQPEVIEELGSFLPDDSEPAEPDPSPDHVSSPNVSPAPDFEAIGPEMDAPPGLEAVPR
jgi:hypothetical protein